MKGYMCAMLLTALVILVSVGQMAAGSSNGAAGQMPAYYDGQLFISNFKEMPAKGTLLQHNKSITTISMCDQCAAGLNFVSVRDAIQDRRSRRCVLPCCSPILAGADVAVLPCCSCDAGKAAGEGAA
jgi:hypothetical protein